MKHLRLVVAFFVAAWVAAVAVSAQVRIVSTGSGQFLGTTGTPQFTRLGLGAAADATAQLNVAGAKLAGGADVLLLRDGEDDQTLRIYGSAQDGEYVSLSMSGANAVVNNVTAGSTLAFGINGSQWLIDGGVANVPFRPSTNNARDIGTATLQPRTVYAGTSVLIATFPATVGVGAYKVARGSTALDGSNPTTVATGLVSVVSCTGTLLRNSALTSGTAFLTHAAASGADVDWYGWVLAGTASTGTETFEWACVGT